MHRKYLKRLRRAIFRFLPSSMRCKLIRYNMPPLSLNLEDIIFRCADSVDDYIKAFRLVHDVYVQAGYIKPRSSCLRITKFHGNPSSRVFLGMRSGCLQDIPVYTVSMFPDSSEYGLPMDQAFKREMDDLRAQGRKLVEIGALASDPCYRQNNMNIPMMGNLIVFKYAYDYLKADDLVITVHPRYRWVYEDLLLFEKIAYVDQYDYVENNPAVAMRLDLGTVEERYRNVYSNMPRGRNLHGFFFGEEISSIIMPKATSISNKILVSSILDYAFSYTLPET